MTDHDTTLLLRFVGGDLDAPAEVLARATTSSSPSLLVAAALLGNDQQVLARAAGLAATTRDRQLVAIASALLDGQADRFGVLVRDHLSEHPDNVLAAWIAGNSNVINQPEKEHVMSTTTNTTTVHPVASPSSPRRSLTRWAISFLGYPLGGAAAWILIDRVDALVPALVGGLVTGVVLGAVQAWALGADRAFRLQWVLATAVGMMAGLGIGAAAVGYSTGIGDLVVQGAISGALVGVAQAVVLRRRIGHLALAWPLILSGAWAAGWAVTTLSGIGVDSQFTIFGASGALVATALTAVLPVVLRRHEMSA